MTYAITETTWVATLKRIVGATNDDTTRTLAQMLLDIIGHCDDPEIGEILDIYGVRLLGHSQPELPL